MGAAPWSLMRACMCRWLGVDHVYLTENSATRSEDLYAQLMDFVGTGFLTYSLEAIPKGQTKVYYDCMSQNYHKHNWMMFFDMDEFLVLTGECAPAVRVAGSRCARGELHGVRCGVVGWLVTVDILAHPENPAGWCLGWCMRCAG